MRAFERTAAGPRRTLPRASSCASRMPAVQGLLHLGGGGEGLALLDAERFQVIDHDPIAIEPRLALHDRD